MIWEGKVGVEDGDIVGFAVGLFVGLEVTSGWGSCAGGPESTTGVPVAVCVGVWVKDAKTIVLNGLSSMELSLSDKMSSIISSSMFGTVNDL